MSPEPPFADLVLEALAGTPVARLLANRPAVVLERIARGAGETHWYYCRDASALRAVAVRLRPGSCVSFHFDGRLGPQPFAPALVSELERIIAEDGDAVFGLPAADGLTIDADFPGGSADLAEVTSSVSLGDVVFCGRFPGRDDDGVDAVALDLPDADGIVRAHPH